MKKIRLSILALVLLGAVACKKTDSGLSITGNVSNDEVADMVAGSLSFNSNGVANVSDDATLDVTAYVNEHLACGTTKSDSIARHNTSGENSYGYNLKYSYLVNCNNNALDNISGSLTYNGIFSGPHLSSTNSGSATFIVAGLSPTAADFVINGEYKRSGTFQSKIDTTNHGSYNVDIVVTNLKLSKPERTIVSGTAAISVTGDVPKKGSFTFTGTLVFNGDGTATLTFNGNVYTINLTTGDKEKH